MTIINDLKEILSPSNIQSVINDDFYNVFQPYKNLQYPKNKLYAYVNIPHHLLNDKRIFVNNIIHNMMEVGVNHILNLNKNKHTKIINETHIDYIITKHQHSYFYLEYSFYSYLQEYIYHNGYYQHILYDTNMNITPWSAKISYITSQPIIDLNTIQLEDVLFCGHDNLKLKLSMLYNDDVICKIDYAKTIIEYKRKVRNKKLDKIISKY